MKIFVAVVDVKQCNLLKTEFENMGIINKNCRFKKSGADRICIPLTGSAKQHLVSSHVYEDMYSVMGITFHLQLEDYINGYLERDFKTPSKRMTLEIKNMMKTKCIWEEYLFSDIPKSWEKYGNLILFDANKGFTSPTWKKVESDLWQCICSVLNVKRIAFKSRIRSDDFRSPRVQLVWGNNSWVDYIDNGIKYSWDVEKNMFSAGNAPERHRISTLKCKDEVVVDMYAGIGYFTLPFLVYGGVKLVHALEWNPHAIKALKINLQQNNVNEKCIVYEGDSHKLCPEDVADRVNLGLLPSCEPGWKTACRALKSSSGGVLHIHQNVVSHLKNKELPGEITNSPLSNSMSNLRIKDLCVCQECCHITELLEKYKMPDVLSADFFSKMNSECSFCMENNLLLPKCLMNVQMKWKNLEWKMWALHVCHSVCRLFCELYGESTAWRVTVANLHHVKSYAPHIDHLVLDLLCTPLLQCPITRDAEE